MNIVRNLSISLFLLVIFTLSASIVEAQATRTWVSGVGDDVNPCSRTAPCKTFAGAISKTADKGEISCLDPGGFGTLNITKSITIDCTGTLGSTLAAGTNGFLINAPAGTVRIRGLMINGASTGIDGVRINAAEKVFIENVVIDGFTLSGVSVVSKDPVKVSLNSLSIRNNTRAGISSTASVGAEVFVTNSLISGNGIGVIASGSATIFSFSGNTIVFNKTNIGSPIDGAKLVLYTNNAIEGFIPTGPAISTGVLK